MRGIRGIGLWSHTRQSLAWYWLVITHEAEPLRMRSQAEPGNEY
ncbi:hypothetical protein [Desulfonema magnum]|nr:hypothetical protein [Desulfonema magnum]